MRERERRVNDTSVHKSERETEDWSGIFTGAVKTGCREFIISNGPCQGKRRRAEIPPVNPAGSDQRLIWSSVSLRKQVGSHKRAVEPKLLLLLPRNWHLQVGETHRSQFHLGGGARHFLPKVATVAHGLSWSGLAMAALPVPAGSSKETLKRRSRAPFSIPPCSTSQRKTRACASELLPTPALKLAMLR